MLPYDTVAGKCRRQARIEANRQLGLNVLFWVTVRFGVRRCYRTAD
jgi:hypothetical protein